MPIKVSGDKNCAPPRPLEDPTAISTIEHDHSGAPTHDSAQLRQLLPLSTEEDARRCYTTILGSPGVVSEVEGALHSAAAGVAEATDKELRHLGPHLSAIKWAAAFQPELAREAIRRVLTIALTSLVRANAVTWTDVTTRPSKVAKKEPTKKDNKDRAQIGTAAPKVTE